MGQTATTNKPPLTTNQALQIKSLLDEPEPGTIKKEDLHKVHRDDYDFLRSRNIRDINKALDFFSSYTLLNSATKDDVSNLNSNLLVLIDSNNISQIPEKQQQPNQYRTENLSTTSLDPEEISHSGSRLLPRELRRVVTHTQLASLLIDNVFEEHGKNMYKRFSFANQRAELDLKPGRSSRPRLSSPQHERFSYIPEEDMEEADDKSGYDSRLKEDMEKIRSSIEGKRSTRKSFMDIKTKPKVVDNNSSGFYREKSDKGKSNTPSPNRSMTNLNYSRKQSSSKTDLKTEKARNCSDKSLKASSRTKSPNSSIHESGKKCQRAADKEKVPVIYKRLEKTSRSISKSKPISSSPPPQKTSKSPRAPKVTTSQQPKMPNTARDRSNPRSQNLNRSYMAQRQPYEDNSRTDESFRTAPVYNPSLHQDLELSPVNVDLNLEDLIQESITVTPFQNYPNNNQGPLHYSDLVTESQYTRERNLPNQAYGYKAYNPVPLQNSYASLHQKSPVNKKAGPVYQSHSAFPAQPDAHSVVMYPNKFNERPREYYPVSQPQPQKPTTKVTFSNPLQKWVHDPTIMPPPTNYINIYDSRGRPVQN